VSLSKAVFTIYGKLIQLGSRKYYATFTSLSVVISTLMTRRKTGDNCVSLRVLHEGEWVSLRVLHFEAKAQREMLVDNLWKMLAEIDICHPIYHDAYELCDMYKQKSLSVFKIRTLEEICAHFELQFKSKNKKHSLIDKIHPCLGNAHVSKQITKLCRCGQILPDKLGPQVCGAWSSIVNPNQVPKTPHANYDVMYFLLLIYTTILRLIKFVEKYQLKLKVIHRMAISCKLL
jgi:hypothetical protein